MDVAWPSIGTVTAYGTSALRVRSRSIRRLATRCNSSRPSPTSARQCAEQSAAEDPAGTRRRCDRALRMEQVLASRSQRAAEASLSAFTPRCTTPSAHPISSATSTTSRGLRRSGTTSLPPQRALYNIPVGQYRSSPASRPFWTRSDQRHHPIAVDDGSRRRRDAALGEAHSNRPDGRRFDGGLRSRA